ncbi:hypothetical protein HN51_065319 [Arachis hypogaea]|uniref:wall-associated receptor kinase-like 10 n=1 Tax=Arachis hypogaea TaxID=3818 RepID=UPI000DECEF9B|nr:wall-associated receptor kinase-like 10 [Arachis hypogaea]
MILQSAFHYYSHIILMIISIYPLLLACAKDLTIAKPGCVSTCGNVDIAYPFGMNDSNCYAHKFFEIECKYHKPYLASFNLEVTQIYVNVSTVEIKNPIYYSCQSKNAFINLTGSPYVYSQEYDKFMAIGCNKLGFLRSNGSKVGGCVSICDGDEAVGKVEFGNDGCHGRYCCETSLPMHVWEYNATIRDIIIGDGSESNTCSYAMIVSDAWLHSYGLGIQKLSNVENMIDVPAVLEWEIRYDMGINSTLSPSRACCDASSLTSPSNTSSGFRCRCLDGYDGNPYIRGGCNAVASGKESGSKWAIVGVSSSLGSVILLLGGWLLYKLIRKRIIKKRKEKFFKKNGGLLLKQKLSSGEENVDKVVLFTLKELENATDNFNLNRVLGKGGQGTVYKGMLVDGKIVAVKKFKVQGNTAEFINEFVVLNQINHRNVVKLLGCCLEDEVPLLVYEFIPNGNLYEHVHEQNENLPMTWDMRLRIASEIAGALFYLHSIASQPIYHRDIKSTNILLDEKYRAKVADFGTSRIVSAEATHLTTVVQGTFGYLDPEYFQTSQFTDKSDVYSFGVVLVELLTGQKAISSIRSDEVRGLASFFVVCMEENRVFDIVDKRVLKEGEKEHIIAVANLAYRCLELNGRKRPTMKQVTLELEGIRRLDYWKGGSAQENFEEIELDRNEDNQLWDGYSYSNMSETLHTTTSSSRELSEVMPILTMK